MKRISAQNLIPFVIRTQMQAMKIPCKWQKRSHDRRLPIIIIDIICTYFFFFIWWINRWITNSIALHTHNFVISLETFLSLYSSHCGSCLAVHYICYIALVKVPDCMIDMPIDWIISKFIILPLYYWATKSTSDVSVSGSWSIRSEHNTRNKTVINMLGNKSFLAFW